MRGHARDVFPRDVGLFPARWLRRLSRRRSTAGDPAVSGTSRVIDLPIEGMTRSAALPHPRIRRGVLLEPWRAPTSRRSRSAWATPTLSSRSHLLASAPDDPARDAFIPLPLLHAAHLMLETLAAPLATGSPSAAYPNLEETAPDLGTGRCSMAGWRKGCPLLSPRRGVAGRNLLDLHRRVLGPQPGAVPGSRSCCGADRQPRTCVGRDARRP